MKQRLLFSVLLVVLFPLCAVCQYGDDFMFRFEGNVKSSKNIISFSPDEKLWNTITISRSGKEKEYFFSSGDKWSQTVVMNVGRKQINTIEKDASGKTVSYHTETYDSADDKIVKQTRTSTRVANNENVERAISVLYEYDTTENKTYITTYGNDGVPIQQLVETRDYSGLLVKKVFYFLAGWQFDSASLLKGSQSNVDYSLSYVYDSKGTLIQTIEYRYGIEGVAERVVNYYNKKGRVSRTCVYDPDDYINCEIKFTYDSKGMVMQKAFRYFNDGETTTHVEKSVYKYDKRGNWISRQDYVAGKLLATYLREIEYWD